MTSLEDDIKAEAQRIFDKATVDVREELPALLAKLGVNTSDKDSSLHAVVVMLVRLLAQYGPEEIRAWLPVVITAAGEAA